MGVESTVYTGYYGNSSGGGGTATVSVTIPAGTDLMHIVVGEGSTKSVVSVSVGGVPATYKAGIAYPINMGKIECWAIDNPPAGVQNVVVTMGENITIDINIVGYKNVGGISAYFTGSGEAAPATIAITGSAVPGIWVMYDEHYYGGVVTYGASQVQIYKAGGGTLNSEGSYKIKGSELTATLTATPQNWGAIGIAIYEAADADDGIADMSEDCVAI